MGTVIYAHILQPGYVKANGQLLSRRDYSNLYKFASENGLLLSESDWANEMQGMFAEGDGVNTFRVPDLRGQFLRALDDGAGVDVDRVLGNVQGDAIRNIIGTFKVANLVGGVNGATDAFYIDEEVGATSSAGGTKGGGRGKLDVSRVVPTATENRPKNVALIVQIKY